ncbi:MAG TPA: hypothetical protein VH592_09555 [Gemmataceae bacterium]|jgi:hypothetical protein
MARIHNDNLPLTCEGNAHQGKDQERAGKTYDVNTFPRMFGEVIGRRIGMTHDDGDYLGCLVRHARADEFQVEILVQRSFRDPNYDPDIRLRTSGAIAMTMRYEGRIDGIDRFTMKGIQSRTWTVGVNSFGDIIRHKDQCPNYDMSIFGVSEETLRRDYGTFFRIADAEAVEAQFGLRQREELAGQDCLALACGCR